VKLRCALLLILAGCTAPAPVIPPPPPPPAVQGFVLRGRPLEVTHLAKDPDRRFPGDRVDLLAAGKAVLTSWPEDRILHLFLPTGEGIYDVAFLDAAGRVLEIGKCPAGDEAGVTSRIEARHALILPAGWAVVNGLAVGDAAQFGDRISRTPAAPMPEVKINGHAVRVETSHLSWQRTRGLMHRPRLSAGDGMLFMYRDEDHHSYWMRNTLIPLDIAYFRTDGALVNVCRMKTYADPVRDEDPRAPSDGPVQFVLEVNFGWFDARKLIDEKGLPAGPVKMEIPDALRALAQEAD